MPYDGEHYDVPDWRAAKVQQYHHIYYRYAIYWAPSISGPPGIQLEIRSDKELVRLYKRGELVKVHSYQTWGGRSTGPDDYPRELNAYTPRSPNYLRRKGAELGKAV